MRIGLDAMGGDKAPFEIIRGGVDAAREYGLGVTFVGKQDVILPQLMPAEIQELDLRIVNAPETIEMQESPISALRDKPNSSIVVGTQLVHRGLAAAFVSAGNSGAVMAAALHILGTIKGIERPAIATVFPTLSGKALLLDVGANADCRPTFLVQFAEMGSIYMERVYGVSRPRVALLSNGEEEGKGSRLVLEAYRLLRKTNLNFVGNVEGKDILAGGVNVVVTDGFTGNVVLKVAEALIATLFDSLKQALMAGSPLGLAGLLAAPALQTVAKSWESSEFGGAPLLGVKGNIIMAHGRSNAKAIKNAILMARETVNQGMPAALEKHSTEQPSPSRA